MTIETNFTPNMTSDEEILKDNLVASCYTLINFVEKKDTIESIAVNVKDLVFTSQKGLTNGVSNLFLEHYNNLPLLERPLWCVDKKRKKLLIKDGEWQEDKDQKKTKEAIEPKFEQTIGLVTDPRNNRSGPIWVRGCIPIESADGTTYEVRNRVTASTVTRQTQ